jgi:PAS domain S-box-containing protein
VVPAEAPTPRSALREAIEIAARGAAWIGSDPREAAEEVAAALGRSLAADLVWIRLAPEPELAPIEVECGDPALAKDRSAELLDAIGRAPAGEPVGVVSARGAAKIRIGVATAGERGLLAVGSKRPGFPGEEERALIAIAASQLAALVASRRAERLGAARFERRLATKDAVGEVLASSRSLAEAGPRILEAVCERFGFAVGALWTPVVGGDELACTELWHAAGADVAAFEAESRRRRFARGVGLPGRVWSSGSSAWIREVAEDPNFPRGKVAEAGGLHTALAFPITSRDEVFGVIELLSRETRGLDEDLLRMMIAIGRQLGLFLERNRAEEASHASERRFARFMEQLPGLGWIKDLEGRYVFANAAAAEVFRAPPPELYGRVDEQIFDADTAARFRANDRRALQSASGVQLIESLEHPDGTLHHSIVSKFPILDGGGAPTGIGGIAIDITDRLRAEEELREADRRKDEFLATLAHELRNPLAPMRSALEVMRGSEPGSEDGERARQILDRQLEHMVRLVDDLLEVSRIRGGRIELRRERVDLASILRDAVETSRPLLDARRHELRIEVPRRALPLHGDAVRLVQVFANLLNNAAKYTDPGGRIALVAAERPEAFEVRVSDTGIGISPGLLPRVFEMFAQADRSASRSHGGLGIGLTLVDTLVRLHGGFVRARSEGSGRGSEFVVTLPRALEVKELARKERPAKVGPLHRVLVVDDNRDAAESLGMLLRSFGHDVRVAFDGPAALASIRSEDPSVVFLDIGMPGMDGYEVVRQLRQSSGVRIPMLIALTGWGQEQDRRRAREAGFDHHLVKPVEAARLRALLADLPRPAG